MSRVPELLIGLTTFVVIRVIPSPENADLWVKLGCSLVASGVFWVGIEMYARRRSRRIFVEGRHNATS